MTIDIKTKNIVLDDPLRVFVESKMRALDKLLNGTPAALDVEIGKPSRHHKKGFVFRAEANLTLGKKLLRGEAMHEDLRTAIIIAKEDLQAQIKKLKGKSADTARRPAKKSKAK